MRQHIVEALVISDVSIRAVATRLGVNRKVLPSIVQKRKIYVKICAAKSSSSSTSPQHDDDQSLEAMQDSFTGGRGSEELGMCYWFAFLQIDPDDDFFSHDDRGPGRKRIGNKIISKNILQSNRGNREKTVRIISR